MMMRRLIPFSIVLLLSSLSVLAQLSDTLYLNQAQFRMLGEEAWYPTKVPGSVQGDLLRLGLLPDLNWGQNEAKVQWPAEESWQYRIPFELSERQLQRARAVLCFEGIDTYASLSLNGEPILEADNMFVGYEQEVKSLLRVGANELLVEIRSPLKEVRPRAAEDDFVYPADNDKSDGHLSVYSRKAPYHYGWDWGPSLVSMGIWRPISLRFEDACALKGKADLSYRLSEKDASCSLHIPLHYPAEGAEDTQSYSIHYSLLDPSGKLVLEQLLKLEPGATSADDSFTLNEPRRWQPLGRGLPLRYQLLVKLLRADGSIAQTSTSKVGFRTVELKREPDQWGRSFCFVVNGEPLYIKGANYIPQTMYLAERDEAYWQDLFRSVEEANMNMLRVWGGGIYEDERFYELADERGILIWQDFIFACSSFPADAAFLDKVEREVEYNVRRLRRHPSLALWCGNNEVREALKYWGWQKRYTKEVYDKMWQDYRTIFEELIPEKLALLDPLRPYVESSPDTANWGRPATLALGESHYWGVWYGKEPFEILQERIPRFMSEFGFQSFPEMKTLRSFAADDELSLDSPTMLARQRSSMGNETILTYIRRELPEPIDFADFVYKGLIVQGQGMRLGIEAQRAAMPYCMGSLYWQLGDVWPAISWSSIDYFGNRKAMHYQVAEAYQPVIIVPQLKDGSLAIVSDLLYDEEEMMIRIEPIGFDGTRYPSSFVRDITIKKNAVTKVKMNWPELLPENLRANTLLKLSLLQDVGSAYADRWAQRYHYALPTKDLALPVAPAIEMELVKRSARRWDLKLKSAVLVKDLFIEVPIQGVHFSQNAFDLLPGEPQVVELELPEGLTALPEPKLNYMNPK